VSRLPLFVRIACYSNDHFASSLSLFTQAGEPMDVDVPATQPPVRQESSGGGEDDLDLTSVR
jgi:hypothetical protein